MGDAPDRIWVKETYEEDGWHFGYWANNSQDDAFVEYVPALEYKRLEKELLEMQQTRALDKTAWRKVGEVMGLDEEESAHTSHVIATLAGVVKDAAQQKGSES